MGVATNWILLAAKLREAAQLGKEIGMTTTLFWALIQGACIAEKRALAIMDARERAAA